MIQEHKDFLVEHYNNWETIQSGYMRNVDMTILRMYEHIYKTYLDRNFVLTHWCSECKMDMVKRIYKLYESLPIENFVEEIGVINGSEPKMEYKGIQVTIETKKRGRKPNKK